MKLIRYLENASLCTVVHTQVDAHFLLALSLSLSLCLSLVQSLFVDFPLEVVIKRKEYSLSVLYG